MRCPKCGYHSFDYLESCKKCGGDLNEHKTKFGLCTPFFQGKGQAAAEATESAATSEPVENLESPPAPEASTDFGYDFLDDSPSGGDSPTETPLDRLLGSGSLTGEEPSGAFETEPGVGGNDSAEETPFDEEFSDSADPELPRETPAWDEDMGSPPEEAGEPWTADFEEGDFDFAEETETEDSAFPPLESDGEEEPDFHFPSEEDEETPPRGPGEGSLIEEEFELSGEGEDLPLPQTDTPIPPEEAGSDAESFSFQAPQSDWSGEETPSPALPAEGENSWDEVFEEDDFEFPETSPEEEQPEEEVPAENPEPGQAPSESGPKGSALCVAADEENAGLAGLLLESLETSTAEGPRLSESLFNFDDTAGDFEPLREIPPAPEETHGASSHPLARSAAFSEAGAEPEKSPATLETPEEEPVLELPPLEEEEPSETALPAPPCDPPSLQSVGRPSLRARFAACAVDLAILCLTLWLFVIAGEAAFSAGARPPLLPSPATLLNLSVPYFLVAFGLFFGYFTLFHFLVGQTPGKMLFGLQVEGQQEDGSLLISQAFLRSVGGLLSILPAGVGFFAAAFDRQGRGWNDRLAGSRVARSHRGSKAAEVMVEMEHEDLEFSS